MRVHFPWRMMLVVGAVLGMILAGCGKSSAHLEGGLPNTLPPETPIIIAATPDLCTHMTRAELSSIVGLAITNVVVTIASAGAVCTLERGPGQSIGSYAVVPTASATSALTVFTNNNCYCPALPGYGDKAELDSGAHPPDLYMVKGKNYFKIEIFLLGTTVTQATLTAAEEQLAQLIVQRF